MGDGMKILMPVDGSSFTTLAAEYLAARLSGAEVSPLVELLHVQAELPAAARRAMGREGVARHYDRAAEQATDGPAAILEAAGARVRRRTERGAPAARIAERAGTIDADLVVMGSHGYTALRELFLGSVTQGVLARTDRPVLVLRGARKSPAALRGPLHAGVAVDGSKASKAALDALLRLQTELGGLASVTLLHAEEPAQVFLDPITGAALPSTGPDRAATLRLLAPLLRKVKRAGHEPREAILLGWPEDVVPAYARRNLDLLVLGSTGRSKLSRALIGSVAAHAAAGSDVPLLLVREPRKVGS